MPFSIHSFLARLLQLTLLSCLATGGKVGANSANSLADANSMPQQKVSYYLNCALLHIQKYGKPDSVFYYATKAYALANEQKDVTGLQKSTLYTAIAYQQRNQFDTSVAILQNLLAKLDPKNDSLKADIYYQLGISNYRWGDKKKALACFIDAIPFYKKNSDDNGLALAYCKIADVLVTDAQNKEANDYKYKAIALLPKLSDPYSKIVSRNLIARIYMDLRSISKTYVDSSIVYAKEAYAMMNEYAYYTRAFQVLSLISDNYFIKEEYETGIQYCKEALKFRSSLYPGELILAYVKFSDYYTIKQDYKNALSYLDSVKAQLPKINVQYYWLNYYQRYFDVNKKAGNLKEAIDGIEHFNSIKDSLYNVEKSREINELAQKYDKVENEKKILELNQEKERADVNNKLLALGIIATVFAIIILIFFYRQSIVKNKLKTIETEQRLNRARMDPHFFFNALSSLQKLVNDDERRKEASDYIANFAKIMRQSLENTYLEMVSIESEIDFLKNYMELQKLRTGNKFNYRFEYDENLEINEIQIPAMLLQPFIENSIEHGFLSMDGACMITIRFEVKAENVFVSILDNGIGLKSSVKSKEHTSRAIQIIKDRLYLLNQKHKTNATFAITEPLQGGTMVEIVLPLLS